MRRILLLTGMLSGVLLATPAMAAEPVQKWNACDASYRNCMSKSESSCDLRQVPLIASRLSPDRQIEIAASCAKTYRRVCAQIHCHRELMLDL